MLAMSPLRKVLSKAACLLDSRGSCDRVAWELLAISQWQGAGWPISTAITLSDSCRGLSSSSRHNSCSSLSAVSNNISIPNSTRHLHSSSTCYRGGDGWIGPGGMPRPLTYRGGEDEESSDELAVVKEEPEEKGLPEYDPNKRYTPASMQEMLEYLIIRKFITTQRTADVMSLVDRIDYAHAHYAMAPEDCYHDTPVPIGRGQFCSPPSVHAVTLQAVEPLIQPGSRVLDVGSGCGYLLTCFGLLATREGLALGIERHTRLVDLASWNLVRCHLALIDGASMEAGGVVLHEGNALEDNVLDELDPFDVIHVGASTQTVPQMLLDLLKPGGRMVIPIGKPLDAQVLTAIDKDKETGELSTTLLGRVKLLPLTPAYADKHGW